MLASVTIPFLTVLTLKHTMLELDDTAVENAFNPVFILIYIFHITILSNSKMHRLFVTFFNLDTKNYNVLAARAYTINENALAARCQND